jgi:DNA-binding transcriptional LysR family regulator
MPGVSDVTTAQLRYFVEAAENLSMTRAAETLLVAQSAVSSSVAQLERSIGVQLFIRKPAKGLILTAAGERFYHEAKALLTSLEEALDSARGQVNEIAGTVTLACFVTLVPFFIPDLLSHLAALHPNLRIEVIETDSEGVMSALQTGRAQLGFGYEFSGGQPLRRTVVGEAKPYVLVSERHRLATSKAKVVALERLRQEPMILLDLPLSRDYFLDMFRQSGDEPEIRYRSGNYETVRSLVAQGQGFSILNQMPASAVTYSGQSVVTLQIRDQIPALPLVISALESVQSTARSRAVSEAVRAVVRSRSAHAQ